MLCLPEALKDAMCVTGVVSASSSSSPPSRLPDDLNGSGGRKEGIMSTPTILRLPPRPFHPHRKNNGGPVLLTDSHTWRRRVEETKKSEWTDIAVFD
jgi:hypothetical protein